MHTVKTRFRPVGFIIAAAVLGLTLSLAHGGPPAGKTAGLHIKQASAVNFRSSSYHVMTDSSGGRWDIQYYGSVYRGTSYSYSGGMYLQIGGTNFQTSNYQGWVNKEGELELGPWSRSNLVIYRRIKAYKKFPLARWLDIIENPSSKPVTVQVAMYSNVRYSVSQSKTSSGGRNVTSKDWAMWTKGSSSRSTPSLHVFTSPDAKVKPAVTVSSSQIYVRYNLTIPAGKTVVLCHFESQNKDTSKLEALMKKFPRKDLLRDLPGSVRRMILNMKAGGWVEGVDLERHAKSDRVMLSNGDMMLGTVGNKSFKIATLLGDMDLPADKLLGMVVGKKGQLRFVMTNGQVIGGTCKGIKLDLALPSGGKLSIPIEKTKQWSYGVSKEKPDDLGEIGPYVALDTGDMLAVKTSSEAMKLRLKSDYGTIDLDPAELLEVGRDKRKGAKTGYLASFTNGSLISGNFESDKLAIQLKLGGRKVDVPRDKVGLIFLSEDDKPNPAASLMMLKNKDRLFGAISDKGYRLTTDFGEAVVSIEKVRSLSFKQAKPDAPYIASVEMFNGSILRGKLDKDYINFKVTDKVSVRIPIGMVTSLVRQEPV